MNLSAFCIRRPVFTLVLNFLMMLIGIISFDRLSVREYPKIDEPVITVETFWKGASAEIIESQVTQRLEESLAGVEQLDMMTSSSRQELSQITLRFKISSDPEVAANDIRNRVSRIRKSLPQDIDEPVVSKVEADAQPILYLAFSGTQQTPLQLTDYADRYVKDRLKTIEGVAEVQLLGQRVLAMRLWLDPFKMAAFNLTVQDVETALTQQNIEVPSGRIESLQREFTVLAESDLRTAEDFNNIVVKVVGDHSVRLQEIGYAELGAVDERSQVRFKGQTAMALGIVKQATANPLDISAAVRQIFPQIQSNLPEGMKVDIAYDSSIFIDRSIKAVYKTIFEAICLVVAVIFLFLRNFRSTLIPLVTIPISLITTFALIYALGFTINTLTLLALVLAIGLVVDDAIVMLENIYRYIEQGMKPFEAALKGSQEIMFAIVSMTTTLVAVYAPIAFMQGKVGRLFLEFALTLACAVLVSGIVALTLSPMMCARLLTHSKTHGKIYTRIENFFLRLNAGYKNALQKLMTKRFLAVLGALLSLGLNVLFFTQLPSELSPVEDRGIIVAIGLAPEGSTLNFTDKYAKVMEGMYQKVPEIEKYFVVSGWPYVSQTLSFMTLKPWEERVRKQQSITAELAQKLFGIPGVLAFAMNPGSLGSSPIKRPVQIVIKSGLSYKELDKIMQKIMIDASTLRSLTFLDTDIKLDKPELRLTLGREKCAALGVSVANVNNTLASLLGGRPITRFKQDGKQYDVILQIQDSQRRVPKDIQNIFVRGKDDAMIQLANLIKIKEGAAPKELNRFDQQHAVTFSAGLNPGFTLGQAIQDLETIVQRHMPSDGQLDYKDQSREFKKTGSEIYITLLLALAFIYLVLSAQFESFRDPFIIMLSVPLAITGSLLALILTKGTLNVYSQIGIVTLIGLITKNGIMIVEFANQLRAQGMGIFESVIEASSLRLRPILMTTAAMILGNIPLALESGAGAESRNSIGWVIVGGLCLGTLLTLFVVPVMYTYITQGKLKKTQFTES
ncbi:MAG: efflux RND transporter permease subunit [Janthinobacterium lividum]